MFTTDIYIFSGTAALRSATGCQTIISKASAAKADLYLNDNDIVKIGLLPTSAFPVFACL